MPISTTHSFMLPLTMHLAITFILVISVVCLALWLRRAQENLRIIAANTPAAIAHVLGHGDQLKYRFVNSKYAELYGQEQSDIIGKHPRQILGPDIFEGAHANMARALKGEKVTFDLKLGEKIVEVDYLPDIAGSNRPRGFIGIIKDVTELRKLQSQNLKS